MNFIWYLWALFSLVDSRKNWATDQIWLWVKLARELAFEFINATNPKTELVVFIMYFSYDVIVLSLNQAVSTAYHSTAYYLLSKPESHTLCYFPEALWTFWFILSSRLIFLYKSVLPVFSTFLGQGFFFHCAHKTQSLGAGSDWKERSQIGALSAEGIVNCNH